MSTKLIKVKENGNIIITQTCTPSKVQKKLINFLWRKCFGNYNISVLLHFY